MVRAGRAKKAGKARHLQARVFLWGLAVLSVLWAGAGCAHQKAYKQNQALGGRAIRASDREAGRGRGAGRERAQREDRPALSREA